MTEYNNTPFWALARKSIIDYGMWLENVRQENDRLVKSGKSGINAMIEYGDTDTQTIIVMMRAAVKFQQCTGEEYRQALNLMQIADTEYRHELMRIELGNESEKGKCFKI